MKLSNETKIGLLAVFTILLFIWGYKFIKGQNILSASTDLFVEYKNVQGLQVSSPVEINGYQVGVVKDIFLKADDKHSVIVEINLKKGIRVPKNAVAVIISSGLMGGKTVEIEYAAPCSGDDCAKNGDYLRGELRGMLATMVGRPEEVDKYLKTFQNNVGGLLDSLDAKLRDAEHNTIAKSFRDLQATLANLKSTTQNLDNTFAASSSSLKSTISNLQSITDNVKSSNDQIKNLLDNAAAVSAQLKNARIDSVARNMNGTITDLDQAVKTTQKTMADLKSILTKIDNGDGSLGQLVNDKKLYNNLESATRDFDKLKKHLELLLQDFRLNPKRYVNVSVFGKKQKAYALPANDPAIVPADSTGKGK